MPKRPEWEFVPEIPESTIVPRNIRKGRRKRQEPEGERVSVSFTTLRTQVREIGMFGRKYYRFTCPVEGCTYHTYPISNYHGALATVSGHIKNIHDRKRKK